MPKLAGEVPGTKQASKWVGPAVCQTVLEGEVKRGSLRPASKNFGGPGRPAPEHSNSLGPLPSRPVTWRRGRNSELGGAALGELGDGAGGGAGTLGWEVAGARGSESQQSCAERTVLRVDMGQIEWAMWANEQALASGLSE